MIYKISRMYMDTVADQEDLFQEIIYQIWKSYASFNGQSQFSSWMYRVSLNTAIVFLKKDKKKVSTSDEMPEHLGIEEDFSKEKELQLEHFYKALQQLDKIEKAIIFYYLEDYSHKDISESLGISEVNARVKLNRAKIKIKELVKKQGYEF
jgi:RNA polymerase sigma factor (sigma-70 family)